MCQDPLGWKIHLVFILVDVVTVFSPLTWWGLTSQSFMIDWFVKNWFKGNEIKAGAGVAIPGHHVPGMQLDWGGEIELV